MKILIMTDMEGCAGILNHDDWVQPTGRYFEKGKRLLTEEVNAAIAGFMDGGVDEIAVVDGHGAGGIDPELLDPRAELERGARRPAYPWGLDESVDGLAHVGQHAKAGTAYSHITHTQWFNYIDLTVNGISMGEYGQTALCGIELGIPSVLACGENAFAQQAETLTPGVVAVGVKQGLLPDGLDDLTTDQYRAAKLSARHLSPARARELIHAGAVEAARRLRTDPGAFHYPDIEPPYVRVARFRKSGDRPAFTARDEHPSSFIELMNMPFTPVD